jgi:exodeoxyribonuclease VII small subunit
MAKRIQQKEEGPEQFDVHLEKLRTIVDKMEQGGLSLDESLRMFEEGISLANRLSAILNRAEGRVEELLATMEKVAFDRGEGEG